MNLKRKFDVIIAPTQFLSYISKEKRELCLQKITEHLKEGGYVIGSVFYTFGSFKRIIGNLYLFFLKNRLKEEFGEWQFEDRCKITMYGKNKLLKLFSRHGLKLDKLIVTKASPLNIGELYYSFKKP